jgi:hypothetical protein
MASLLCVLALVQPPRAWAQSDDSAEYRVKLAFLYNFAQFIQWPADAFSGPAAPLTMCVAGQDPFKGEIGQRLHGRTAAGHPIQIRRLKPDDDPQACHIVFVRAGEKRAAAEILAALKGSNTLTVGESKGFAEKGGLINLTLDEDKLSFEINLAAAMRTRLKISSKVLALARIVGEGHKP